MKEFFRTWSLLILVIFHLVGLAGLSGTEAMDFARLTPLNLLLSAFLLGLHHENAGPRFLPAAAAVFISGILVEWVGIRTGLIFGNYYYGESLGVKVDGVPLIIGLNWMLLVYCVSVMVRPLRTGLFPKALTGGLLMTAMDFLIEPAAMRYDFWQWENGIVPLQNYIAWFVVSAMFTGFLLKAGKPGSNSFAAPLFLVQFLFFALLNVLPLMNTAMPATVNILAVIITFFAMEFVAWFTHKYIMHGLLWILHKDHHQKEPGFFEKNDSFFLIFAVPSAILMMLGMMNGNDVKLFIGIGIALYGLAYFLVHDIFIHQRFRIFRRSNNTYMRAIRKAHKVHHKHLGKEHGECFGMLLVPYRYFKEAQRMKDSGVLPD